MPGAKEIRSKIGSVKNTQKITRAMEMVAASKIRRTQQRMNAARPYADGISKIASHLYHARPDYTPPYREEQVDRVYLARNLFANTMRQQPVIQQLLPVALEKDDQLATHWDYIYEPSAGELLDGVLERYIETQVFRAAMENVACEMAAKMVAMKSATDNAGKLIDSLQLQYNKARQAAITAEIAEIIAGAEAV